MPRHSTSPALPSSDTPSPPCLPAPSGPPTVPLLQDRPEENVLVLDVTAFGDVSHLLLGGAKDDHAVKKMLAAARDETHAGEMMRHLARVYGVPAPGGGGGGTANGHGAVEPVTPVKAPNSIAMVTRWAPCTWASPPCRGPLQCAHSQGEPIRPCPCCCMLEGPATNS